MMNKAPNIILIMTDSQGANVVERYSGQATDTQHLDRLADTGVRFDSAYTTCPLCTPARAGLFTGMYSHQSGAWTNNLALGSNIRHMGQIFTAEGYNTGYIGKWHLDGHDYFGTGVCPPGWHPEYWYDGVNYLNELTEEEITLWRRGLNTPEELEAHEITADFTWGHRITNRGLKFIEEHRHEEKPFLLVLSYDEPHHPFTCPPKHVEKFKDFKFDLGEAAFDSLESKPLHHRLWSRAKGAGVGSQYFINPLYFGCNDFVDEEIGRVLSHLDETELANTWIVYTSDHGEMNGAHKLWGKGAAVYDEITNIPLIIKNTDGQLAGTVVDRPVSHIDIMPTLLKLAHIEQPPIMPGNDLLDDTKERVFDGVMVEFNRYEVEHDSNGGFIPVRGWVTDKFKLVINLLGTDELYDRVNDKAENNNLIEHPDFVEVRNALHDELLAYMDHIRDTFRTFEWACRPWRPEKEREWMGLFRPRPADGVAPVVRDYDTGLPTKGIKREDVQLSIEV